MEKQPNFPGNRPFNWRTFVSKEVPINLQEKLDTVAELAAEQNLDFVKMEKDFKANIPNPASKEALSEFVPIDQMIVWGYKNGILTDEEYRQLQAATL